MSTKMSGVQGTDRKLRIKMEVAKMSPMLSFQCYHHCCLPVLCEEDAHVFMGPSKFARSTFSGDISPRAFF